MFAYQIYCKITITKPTITETDFKWICGPFAVNVHCQKPHIVGIIITKHYNLVFEAITSLAAIYVGKEFRVI